MKKMLGIVAAVAASLILAGCGGDVRLPANTVAACYLDVDRTLLNVKDIAEMVIDKLPKDMREEAEKAYEEAIEQYKKNFRCFDVEWAVATVGMDKSSPEPTAANNGALGGADSFATGDAATAPGGETAGSEPTRRERMLESLQQARRQRQTRYDSLANANRQEAQEPQETQETAEPAQEPEYSVPTPRTNQTNRTNRTQPEEQDSGGGPATGLRASDGNADSDGPAARRARLLETLRAAREQRQSRYSSETEAGESEP